MHKSTLSIPVPPGFDLKTTALSHGWHECAPVSWAEGGACLQFVTRRNAAACRGSLTQPGGGEAGGNRLRLTVEHAEPDDDLLDQIASDVRTMLQLDHDLSDFHALCRNHPRLHVLEAIGAGRLLRSPDMFENIVKTICGTNVNWLQAVKMINRLVQLGPTVPHFRNLSAFPTPAEIMKAGEGYLNDVCRLGYRTASILRLCADVRAKRLDFAAIEAAARDDSIPSDKLVAPLRAIHGVGAASANFLLALLGRHDRLGIDSWTLTYVGRVYFKGRKATPKQVEKVYAPYGRWKHLVWWWEQWLTWGTAQQILRERGIDHPANSG